MFWGFVFLATGIGWVLRDLGFLPKQMDVFWPILFIALGISIIVKSRKRTSYWTFWERVDKNKD